MGDGLMQIGEVAQRTALSLRTIRYYEEVGLIVPSARSQGGFRLYAPADVDRLQVVKRMKSLGFTLDQMRELLDVISRLTVAPTTAERAQLSAALHGYREAVRARCTALREQLATTHEFDDRLAGHVATLHTNPTD